MNIDEAIKILETEAHLAERQPETGIYSALKLSIEALKRIKTYRHSIGWRPSILLPGETED